MIDFYTADSSNGQRVAIMLEECGLPYKLVKLDLMGGEQRKPEFLKVNPAGAIPAIVDPDGPGGKPLSLAQSAAIVLYLAEKTQHFLPQDSARRAEALQWLMQATTDTAASSLGIFLLSTFAPEKSDANVAFFEERVLRKAAHPDRILHRRALPSNGKVRALPGDWHDPQVQRRSRAAVQPHFLLAIEPPYVERGEIEEPEIHRLLDLVRMDARQQDRGDVRFDHFHAQWQGGAWRKVLRRVAPRIAQLAGHAFERQRNRP